MIAGQSIKEESMMLHSMRKFIQAAERSSWVKAKTALSYSKSIIRGSIASS